MSGKGASSRHRGREVALQTLYAFDLAKLRRKLDEVPVDADEVFRGVAAHFEAPRGACAFAWELIEEVCRLRDELDALIAAWARNWRISRMAAVDRNILRLGAYELAHTTTPAAVVLNEAVELARRFGSDASPSFVNGILDALAHELRQGEL